MVSLSDKTVYKHHLQFSKEKGSGDNLRAQKLCCMSSSENIDAYVMHNVHTFYLLTAANL